MPPLLGDGLLLAAKTAKLFFLARRCHDLFAMILLLVVIYYVNGEAIEEFSFVGFGDSIIGKLQRDSDSDIVLHFATTAFTIKIEVHSSEKKTKANRVVKFNSSICLTWTRRRGNGADVPVGLFLEF